MIKKIKLSIKASKKILYRKDLYKIRHKDQMKINKQINKEMSGKQK